MESDQQQPEAAQPVIEVVKTKGNIVIAIIIGVVLLLVIGIGYYLFYLNSNAKTKQDTNGQTNSSVIELKNELDSINLGDLDQEFSGIDKDLQSL